MNANREKEILDEKLDDVEGEGEEEEEEEEEQEPRLAYSLMKNDINEILKNDSVSCIKANDKVS